MAQSFPQTKDPKQSKLKTSNPENNKVNISASNTSTMQETKSLIYANVPAVSPDLNGGEEEQLSLSRSQRSKGLAVGVGGVLLVCALLVCVASKTSVIIQQKQGAQSNTPTNTAFRTLLRRNLVSPRGLCFRPITGDTCSTEESYGECLLLEQRGCRKIASTDTCPPSFQCVDRCIRPWDSCGTPNSYGQCLQIEYDGCQTIAQTASCPPHFYCVDPPTPEHPTTHPIPIEPERPTTDHSTTHAIEPTIPFHPIELPTPVHPIERPSQCIAPVAGHGCQTEESYQECLRLEDQGCEMLLSTLSCPPFYQCAEPLPVPRH